MPRYISRTACVVLIFLLASPILAENAQEHSASMRREFSAMHWTTGTQKLTESHGTFNVPKYSKIVLGYEAKHADMLINGRNSSLVEGIAFTRGRTLYLSYADDGFITTDDWKNVNADELLKNISNVTEQDNENRLKNGMSAMHVDRWIQRPTFDEERKSVRWIFGAHNASGKIVNAVALQLGRHGYERFTLASDGSDSAGDTVLLADAVHRYIFDPGFRFSDHVQGDKLAGYGIAALVGTAAGATIAKTVGFSAILLLFKKLFVLIITGIAMLFKSVKRFFVGIKKQIG